MLLNIEHFGEMFSRNGDGFIFYPGDHKGEAEGKGSPAWLSIDGPIVSYRMKQIRDGLEDWELFVMAKKLGAEDFVRSQVSRVYTRFGDFPWEGCDSEGFYCPERPPWSLDEQELLDARHQVALKIQYLLHPELYDDPEATPDGDVDDADVAELADETETIVNTNNSGCAASPGTALALLLLGMAFRRRNSAGS